MRAERSSALLIAVGSVEGSSLFNNSEGKAFAGLDESLANRVEMYLGPFCEHKRRGTGWRKHARKGVGPGDRVHDLWGQATKCM